MDRNLARSHAQSQDSGMESGSEIIVFVTASSGGEAEKIARPLVETGLAACANILGPVKSIYIWEQKLTEDTEIMIVFKTQRHLFRALEEEIKRLHSYQVPEIIAVPIVMGSEDYLNWMTVNTRK
ncbi:MAG: divalent-cation tolerance protein CutA [Nitrospiraceae bacterium]